MTRITCNTKDCFELDGQKLESLECSIEEDDDGTLRLFINGVELTPLQCLRLRDWLDRSYKRLARKP